MFKKLTLSIVLVFVALFVVGCTIKNPFAKKVSTETGQTPGATASGSGKSIGEEIVESFNDLLKKGDSVVCNSEISDESGKVAVEMYVSGAKFRTNSVATDTEGTVVNSHMVSDGDFAYLWGDSQPGMKIKYSDLNQDKPEISAEELKSQQTSALQKAMEGYSFKCKPWILVDSSKFTAPSDVEFTDISESMKQLQQQGSEANKSLCQMCDKLEDSTEKADCLAKLKCK